jgi:hypothetical protein
MNIEALHALVAEWEREAEFLTNNSVGSDIAVGNTYNECAKRLAELIGTTPPEEDICPNCEQPLMCGQDGLPFCFGCGYTNEEEDE